MKIYDIKRPNKYEKNGEEKTQWLDVGRIVQFDDGGLKLELNHTSEKFMVFERKPKEQSYSAPPQQDNSSDINVEDIPF